MHWDKIAISKHEKIIRAFVTGPSFHLEIVWLPEECQVRIRYERFNNLMGVSRLRTLGEGFEFQQE